MSCQTGELCSSLCATQRGDTAQLEARERQQSALWAACWCKRGDGREQRVLCLDAARHRIVLLQKHSCAPAGLHDRQLPLAGLWQVRVWGSPEYAGQSGLLCL